MADFDDLITPSRSNPTLDNPFEDPFADVVRPRSPDPWAMATSYYPEPEPIPSISHPDTYTSGAVTPPIVEVQLETTAKLAQDTVSIDPLAAEASSPSDDVPLKRNPFGPLPVVRLEPSKPVSEPSPAPQSAISAVPASDAPLSSPVIVIATPESPKQVSAESSEAVIIVSPGPSTPLEASRSSTPPPKSISSQSQSEIAASPSHEPPAASSSSPRSSSPSSFTQGTSHSSAPISASVSSSVDAPSDTTTHYDRIVSPLQTPNHYPSRSPLERSFNSLSLGGETVGWGGISPSFPSASQSSYVNESKLDEEDRPETPVESANDANIVNQSVTTIKEVPTSDPKSIPPLFVITVGDPQKVGDPISAHIVYTVSTKTTSTNFGKSSFSVLRRYSDFLWLYEALIANNPGVVVPPVPEKHPYGRFQGAFVESRRLALNKCIQKIANHPRLSNDPDLKLFLESDSFVLDIKHRKAEAAQERGGGGLMATIGSSIIGPKYYETDEWFDKKKTYLDGLESQLRGLVKSIEAVSKQQAEVALATQEFADAIAALGNSDLSKQLSASLVALAEVENKSKEVQDAQVKADIVSVLGTVEEYTRLISSVRSTFASRVRAYHNWKAADAERNRVKLINEKALRQRTLDNQSIFALQREIEVVESKAQEAHSEFENVTKLIKSELARFEQERVDDFKTSLETFLEGMIARQNDMIDTWEQYQQSLLKRAGMNANGGQVQEAR